MAAPTSRRALLRGEFSGQSSTRMLPPGANEQRFHSACTRCAACAQACPEAIIVNDARGWPVVDLTRGPCTFCGACAEACPTTALDPQRMAEWPWRALVLSGCLALNRVSCRSCEDFCDASAIRFQLKPGGRAQPVIDLDLCTGCGACASVCPAQAIGFERSHRDSRNPIAMEVAE